ncbi:MAG: BON domain-containing protein [Bryobacteraceae bacterium]
MNRILLSAILSGTILLHGLHLSAAPGDTKAPPAKPTPSQGTNSQQDKEIEATIKAKLAKSKIGKDGFTVHVQGGVATWEGATSVVQHKGAATRMAKTAGAKKVVNNIKISEEARTAATGNLDEGRRRVQVKRGETRSQ